MGLPWVAACMEPEEWVLWIGKHGRPATGSATDGPCQDCPLGYAAEMRAEGRCNGTPGGVDDDEEDELSTITRLEAKPVQVAVQAPCPRCTHRDVCAIKNQLDDAIAEGVEVGLPVLNPALTPTVSLAVDCSFFLPERKAGRPSTLTPEQRQAAGERLRAGRVAKGLEPARHERPAA